MSSSSYSCWKDWTILAFLWKNQLNAYICFFLDCLFHWNTFTSQYYTVLIIVILYLDFKTDNISPPMLLSFKIVLTILIICISILDLETACQFLPKKICWNFRQNCIMSIYQFWDNWSLKILILPIHEHRMILYSRSSSISMSNYMALPRMSELSFEENAWQSSWC